MRYLITVSYDGSKYYGFQKLNKNKSVQEELEKALTKINKKKVCVKGSGRTDRGVHALAQKCHFDLDISIESNRLVNAINSLVDNYIHVIDCKVVSNDFHARFMVQKKTYKYIINLGDYDAIRNDYIYNYCRKLNVVSMKKASKYLIGRKSFKAFVSGKRDNYDSEIYKINFKSNKNMLEIEFVGKSFYRYMIRNMVGALMLVGKEKITVEQFNQMILEGYNKYTYMTVPASGLYLVSVEY